jgi:hypothetical protein
LTSASRPMVREAVMDRIMVVMDVGMAVLFGTRVMVGVIAMVSMAIRGENKRGSLTGNVLMS